MLPKSADSVSDFKVIDDSGFRRISVLGMGWTGYTLEKLSVHDIFEGIDDNEGVKMDIAELNSAAFEVVRDDELSKMARYFYNLGRQHGIEVTKDEMGKKTS
jgi:hypothetical protein